jgi:hypothetical protein
MSAVSMVKTIVAKIAEMNGRNLKAVLDYKERYNVAPVLTEKMQDKFALENKEAERYYCVPQGNNTFAVSFISETRHHTHTVNLQMKQCDCKDSGSVHITKLMRPTFPCRHILCALTFSKRDKEIFSEPEQWFHKCCLLKNLERSYNEIITLTSLPIYSYSESNLSSPNFPINSVFPITSNRSQKCNRIKSIGELGQGNTARKCDHCQDYHHTWKTCPLKDFPLEKIEIMRNEHENNFSIWLCTLPSPCTHTKVSIVDIETLKRPLSSILDEDTSSNSSNISVTKKLKPVSDESKGIVDLTNLCDHNVCNLNIDINIILVKSLADWRTDLSQMGHMSVTYDMKYSVAVKNIEMLYDSHSLLVDDVIHYFFSYFIAKLCSNNIQCTDCMYSVTEHLKLLVIEPSTELMFFPINKSFHWVLVCISLAKLSVTYYDSMACAKKEIQKNYFDPILSWLKDKYPQNNFSTYIVTQQRKQVNSFDCGLYCIATGLLLMGGKDDVNISPEYAAYCRLHFIPYLLSPSHRGSYWKTFPSSRVGMLFPTLYL